MIASKRLMRIAAPSPVSWRRYSAARMEERA
jgi:hypothetical protein